VGSAGELAHVAVEREELAGDMSARWVVDGGAHGKKYRSDGDGKKDR